MIPILNQFSLFISMIGSKVGHINEDTLPNTLSKLIPRDIRTCFNIIVKILYFCYLNIPYGLNLLEQRMLNILF